MLYARLMRKLASLVCLCLLLNACAAQAETPETDQLEKLILGTAAVVYTLTLVTGTLIGAQVYAVEAEASAYEALYREWISNTNLDRSSRANVGAYAVMFSLLRQIDRHEAQAHNARVAVCCFADHNEIGSTISELYEAMRQLAQRGERSRLKTAADHWVHGRVAESFQELMRGASRGSQRARLLTREIEKERARIRSINHPEEFSNIRQLANRARQALQRLNSRYSKMYENQQPYSFDGSGGAPPPSNTKTDECDYWAPQNAYLRQISEQFLHVLQAAEHLYALSAIHRFKGARRLLATTKLSAAIDALDMSIKSQSSLDCDLESLWNYLKASWDALRKTGHG